MRTWISLAGIAAVMFAGCHKSPEGGAPGTSSSFTITAPTTTTIKQNNKETVNLTLNRGSDFKQVVKLSATHPDKVKVELSKDSVAPSEPGEVALTITVEKNAALGDHIIKVTGTPEGGTATSVDVKLHVTSNP